MSELLFYDGDCGLCHGAVKFVVARDREGKRFRYAPLHGPTFLAKVPESARKNLPDSIVILTEDGRILYKWEAARYIGKKLGGGPAFLSALSGIVPPSLGDSFYDWVARNRHRFFEKPQAACPVASPELRARFDP
ncbi:MAG: DUF393 domain-containing protein [Bdellovibrionota bacterium]